MIQQFGSNPSGAIIGLVIILIAYFMEWIYKSLGLKAI